MSSAAGSSHVEVIGAQRSPPESVPVIMEAGQGLTMTRIVLNKGEDDEVVSLLTSSASWWCHCAPYQHMMSPLCITLPFSNFVNSWRWLMHAVLPIHCYTDCNQRPCSYEWIHHWPRVVLYYQVLVTVEAFAHSSVELLILSLMLLHPWYVLSQRFRTLIWYLSLQMLPKVVSITIFSVFVSNRVVPDLKASVLKAVPFCIMCTAHWLATFIQHCSAIVKWQSCEYIMSIQPCISSPERYYKHTTWSLFQECHGYRRSIVKTIVFWVCVLLTGGLLFLITHWRPDWRVKLTHVRSTLAKATLVILLVSLLSLYLLILCDSFIISINTYICFQLCMQASHFMTVCSYVFF